MADKVVIRLINPRPQGPAEDPAPPQIVVYHWGRIAVALLIVALMLLALIAGARHLLRALDGPAEPPVGQSPAPETKAARTEPSTTVAGIQAAQKPPSSGSASVPSEPESPPPARGDAKTTAAEATHPAETPSNQVLILSGNIRRAQLTRSLIGGTPQDRLDGIIPMNAKGLIKVFLYMETTGLKGRVLYHDWYWKDKLIAHARIPVKRNDQNCATSKYIDRIMTGPWRVAVVDDRKKVYAEARFEVR